jgi:hypothetical protein
MSSPEGVGPLPAVRAAAAPDLEDSGCTLGQVVGIKEVHDDVWLVSNAWRDRR